MIDLEQKVIVKWSPTTKQHYIQLGYKYTKLWDTFEVKAKDLTLGSEVLVKVICDYCGKEFYKSYKEYNYQHNELGDCCAECLQTKAKKSFKNKYGVDNASYVKDFCQKRESTCLEKFGAKNVFELQKFQDKAKETMREKHGVDHALQNEDFLIKSRETLFDNYGVYYTMQSPEIKSKSEQTNLEKYGVTNVLCKPEVRELALTKMTSKPQNELNDLLIEIYGKAELNKPFHGYWLDSAITVDGVNVDVEFDGNYWHQDEEKDNHRNEVIQSYGYKVLRIKSDRRIPDKEQLIRIIDELVHSDKTLKIIII